MAFSYLQMLKDKKNKLDSIQKVSQLIERYAICEQYSRSYEGKHRAAAWIISHILLNYFGVRDAQCFLRRLEIRIQTSERCFHPVRC